jgi:hypothetical protein
MPELPHTDIIDPAGVGDDCKYGLQHIDEKTLIVYESFGVKVKLPPVPAPLTI